VHDELMISVDLARRLRDAGLRWRPASGDRFVIDRGELADDVFTLSDMTIEAHHFPSGTELGFNGTTEWALDSVSDDDALWLPREDQLRALLGPAFVSLSADGELLTVTTTANAFTSTEAEEAYGHALLAYIEAALTLE
jgi:hypothetical protein